MLLATTCGRFRRPEERESRGWRRWRSDTTSETAVRVAVSAAMVEVAVVGGDGGGTAKRRGRVGRGKKLL